MNFFKRIMGKEDPKRTPAVEGQPETAALTPAVPTETSKEKVDIREEKTPPGMPPKPHQDTRPEEEPFKTGSGSQEAHTNVPTPTSYLLNEFCEDFVPCSQNGEPLIVMGWEHIPRIVLGVIGQGKIWALAAAHKHQCWTVVKRDGTHYIEAGMNTSDPDKIGYLITQNPWRHIDDNVLPVLGVNASKT